MSEQAKVIKIKRGKVGTKPIGRPSEYVPEYCDQVREFMGRGYSLTAFAGAIGKSRECVYHWEQTIPAFSDAVKAARAMRVIALERGLFSAEGAQVTAHIFALKNACRAEWMEVSRTEVTGKDGGPVEVETASREQILAEIAKRQPKVVT